MEFQQFEKDLEKLGFVDLSATKLNHGRNSLAWKIKTHDRNYFLKYYRAGKRDNRDRIGAEKRFLTLLKNAQITNVPKIVHVNEEKKWILLDWIDGKKLTQPKKKDWKMMLAFIQKLQELRDSEFSCDITNASEACFRIEDHINLIERRLNNLIHQLKNLSDNSFILDWLKGEVLLSLQNSRRKFEYLSNNRNLKIGIKKILSPSDVGFHNVLKREEKLYFYDFEYSGWDDPFKLLVDLLIHPDYVVKTKIADYIFANFQNILTVNKQDHRLRFYIYLYRIKWVCIIFNNLSQDMKNNKSLFLKSYNYFVNVRDIWNL